jgi:DeoR family ulaG and ulaABCDEF operon transcriptional repressor
MSLDLLRAEEREQMILGMLEKRGVISFANWTSTFPPALPPCGATWDAWPPPGASCAYAVAQKTPEVSATNLTGVPFHEDIRKSAPQKAAIGKAAAALCTAGEPIIIDGGSTESPDAWQIAN